MGFKTKLDPNENVKRYKARLATNGYTQKDSLRIIMALVAHFDLELHQMDIRTAFLNSDSDEDVFMKHPEGFEPEGQEHLVCMLKKSEYGLNKHHVNGI